ncbi:MAG TPA: DUF4340 domain-containing protein [Polyangia bacterium]|nr:DUF4340 domain-containing protein [Polyangia bacterium]
MNKKTLTALGAFVVLGIIAIVALRQPEKGERASDHPRPLPVLNPVEITTLDVTKGGTTTTIKNEGGIYKVTAPVTYPADASNAKAAFDGLGKMDINDLVTSQPDKQAEFEVDDKSGVHVVAKHDGKVLADFVVGKSMGGGTMLRPTGSNDVWRASGISKFTFDKGPTEWRDKGITTFIAAEAEKLDVAAKDGAKISLKKTGTKEGSEEKWDVVSSSLKIEKLDNAVPNGIVTALANWKANDFADGTTPAQAGLDAPELTVTVGLKGGRSVTALVGGKKGDDTYVKKSDAPQIFLVKKFNLERMDKRPLEFRDKTLCDLPADDLTEIAVSAGDKSYTLTKSGGAWKASKPAKLELDTSKVTPIAGAFKDWKAAGFADDQSLKDNGLAKPRVITVKAKSNKTSAPACQVRVGDETKDKVDYYVATAKSPDVLLAPKWAVDRILVKPDDLKGSGGTTASAKPASPAGKKLAAKK